MRWIWVSSINTFTYEESKSKSTLFWSSVYPFKRTNSCDPTFHRIITQTQEFVTWGDVYYLLTHIV